MVGLFSDTDLYVNKHVSWDIKNEGIFYCSSSIFVLNKHECTLRVDISPINFNQQFKIDAVSLNFSKNYEDCQLQFIVIVYIADFLTAYTFKLYPTENNQSFVSNCSQLINDTTLVNQKCRITAVIFYQKTEDRKISTLLDDMKRLLKSQVHSDFKIKAGDKTFDVHKAVIANRCNVLKKMVENDMLEKMSGVLELAYDPIVVQAMLDYLYTSKCRVTTAPTELFRLAHYLQIEELQTHCKKYLINNITLKNIISILELTNFNDFNIEDLHEEAMKFVNINEDTLVTDSDFENYLCRNIRLETTYFILKLSYNHNLEDTLNKVLEFIRLNYNSVFNDPEIEAYLKTHPVLTLKIARYCLDFYNTAD